MIRHDGVAPSRSQERAIARGVAAMGLGLESLDVLFTSHFDHAIRGLTASDEYTSDRGTGAAAAKTVTRDAGSVIVMNAEVFASDCALLERTAAHECGHVLLHSRNETVNDRQYVTSSDWEWFLAYLAGTAMEELRIEKALKHQGYPPSGSCEMDHVAIVLHWTNGDLLRVVQEPASAEPLNLMKGVMAVADRLTKLLAYLAAFEPEDAIADLAVEGALALEGWREFVAPTWSKRANLYRALPPADETLEQDLWDDCLRAGVMLEHALVNSLGFAFREDSGGWGFYGQVSIETWGRRLRRARAQEAIYDEEDRAADLSENA